MANVFDYLDWRGDLKFWEVPFCEIDALILSELAYIDYDAIIPECYSDGLVTIGDAARRYSTLYRGKKKSLGAIVPAEIIDLFLKSAECKRYSDIALCGYVNIVEDSLSAQFSAITAKLSDGTVFVGYRGTDDSFAGWKEDFQLSFKDSVPAQHCAEKYLANAASRFNAPLRVAGHSKGGNLALWAAANCPKYVSERILSVYNFDGPGFIKNFHNTEGYIRLKDRIKTIVPECSIVGMFLEHEGSYGVIKSTARGIRQHNGLTWNVLGSKFVYSEDITDEGKRVNELLKRWIYEMTEDQREKFTNAVFDILYSTKTNTLIDLTSDRSALWRAFSTASPEIKQAFFSGIRVLLGEGEKLFEERFKFLKKQ